MHPQNLPINRCNPSPETTISQVTTYHCFYSSHQKYIHSYIFHHSSVFTPIYSHIHVKKMGRVTKSVTLPYKFYTSEFFNPSFVVWFPVTPFWIFIPQWNQVLLYPVRFDSSMVFFIVQLCSILILSGIIKILFSGWVANRDSNMEANYYSPQYFIHCSPLCFLKNIYKG